MSRTRTGVVVLATLATVAGAALATGTSALAAPASAAASHSAVASAAAVHVDARTRLVVVVRNPVAGAHARVTVRGPRGWRKVIGATTVFAGLVPGRYTIDAPTVDARGGRAVTSVTTSELTVAVRTTGRVTVRYRLAHLPGAPASPAAVAGPRSASLTWTAPADGGAAITDYLVQEQIAAGVWTTVPDGVSAAPVAAVNALHTVTQYRFRIAAVTAAGTGAFSTASGYVIPSTDCTLASLPDLHACDLNHQDLSHQDLAKADLAGAVLIGARLDGSVLDSAHLAGADLTGASAVGAHLAGADLTGAVLVNADLTDAVLDNATLTHAVVAGSTMLRTSLVNVTSGTLQGAPAVLPTGWHQVSGYLAGPRANLTDAIFTNATLAGLDLHQATLTGAALDGTNLTGTDLGGAVLTGSDMTDAIVSGTILVGATLDNVVSSGLVGVPASLPTYWAISGGSFVPVP